MLNLVLGVLSGWVSWTAIVVGRKMEKKARERCNRLFSHDVTAAILVSQNNETVTMLVSQTSPVGVELFSYANAFFCSD